ncbi:hypothetical protein PILCRDRAFT_95788 [Piloderma croceum F 1598]|uniref:Thioester reductase (TE) domain-containing protein n=1 Tax=Piloderma croceum (strain F 1598) TaxID=765440 RepID=A0A0C3FTE6_PILCF|nr:hypothetical protein PILCRDRAFT_95788 [Piloderma croceum F 1598]
MSSTTNIFITGATGYIGGTVLSRLLTHPSAPTFKITALVRSPEKAAKLQSAANNISAVASADDLGGMKAILSGLKKRYEKTGVLVDDQRAKGMYAIEKIYSDTDIDAIESLPLKAWHRAVDVEVVKADTEGYAKTYIILPSVIYGISTGPIADLDADVQHLHSIVLPMLIKASLGRGQAAVVGEGKNIWANVEIGEIADLYIILYDAILSDPSTAHGREGFYFGENGEHTLYEASKAISEAMLARGKGQTLEPTSGLLIFFGTNSRCRADRSRSIGWKPVKTTRDMLASIQPEVDAVLNLTLTK